MKIITIANRKGGTGKTVTSYNLGYSLALQGNRILFIDLDSQGNLTHLCDKSPVSVDIWKSGQIVGVNKSVSILPATKSFAMIENEINQRFDRNTYLSEDFFPELDQRFDYVIIDTPPGLSILNINAFVASDNVIVVVNPDSFSLIGMKEMEEILNKVRKLNQSLRYHVVLNAYFNRRVFTEGAMERLKLLSSYSGVEIPHRQHVINMSAQKRPAIDHNDLSKPFNELCEVIR